VAAQILIKRKSSFHWEWATSKRLEKDRALVAVWAKLRLEILEIINSPVEEFPKMTFIIRSLSGSWYETGDCLNILQLRVVNVHSYQCCVSVAGCLEPDDL